MANDIDNRVLCDVVRGFANRIENELSNETGISGYEYQIVLGIIIDLVKDFERSHPYD
jgi:hypothetical protein